MGVPLKNKIMLKIRPLKPPTRSLCEGRNIYISNQKRWIELTDITVVVESSSKMKEDTPELLTALVSKASVICLEENFEELQLIFTELLTIYFDQVSFGEKEKDDNNISGSLFEYSQSWG